MITSSLAKVGGLALLSVLLLAPARAQPADEPFDTMSLHLGGSVNVNHARLHDFWQPGYGLTFGLDTPFHIGRLEAGGALYRFDNRRAGDPRFDALELHLGWGLRRPLAPRLRGMASFRLGNTLMRFADDEVGPGLKRENELTLALHGRLAFRVTDPWAVFVSGSYQKTFTAVRINLWYVSLGLRRTLRTPGWLKTFLQ